MSALPTELDAAFTHVAQRVRFEPYPGVLRGAKGTAIAGAGNSWDKAALLAELLRRGGYEVRFVEGELTAANAETLLRGAFPPRLPDPKLGPDFAPYVPASDTHLKQALEPHVWLEVNQGETWLPLDPSFPRARPGEAYATRRRHFSRPPRDAFHRVLVSWKEVGHDTRELAQLELNAAEVGLVPVMLSAMGAPLESKAPRTTKAGGVVSMFGGAFGGGAKPEPEPEKKPSGDPKTVGVMVKRSIVVGDRLQEAESTLVRFDEARTRPQREWLEVTLLVPGRAPQTFRRELFDARGQGLSDEALLSHRRYSLGIFTGPVPLAALDEQFKRGRQLPLDDWREQAEDLSEDRAGVRKAEALAQQLGPVPGHLLVLSHAQASDALSDRLAQAAGVLVLREKPRVLIASVETTGQEEKPTQTVSLDLRVDEVRAVPWPGQPARAAELFQRARGMMSSTIEGHVVAQATGREPATTSALMDKAREQGVRLVALASRNELGKLREVTQEGYDLLSAVLQTGRHAVVPEKKLMLAGRERTGFWEVDPLTGAVVGVMDDGLRQAMVQYQLELSKIGLDERSGKVFGALVGDITVIGILSAKILEHGEVNEEVLEEVKKYAEGILCYSCPKAEAKAGLKVALGEDCWKKEVMAEGFAKVDFCEGYTDGFKCSVGLLLAAYDGKGKAGYEPNMKFEKGAELACNKWPAEDDK